MAIYSSERGPVVSNRPQSIDHKGHKVTRRQTSRPLSLCTFVSFVVNGLVADKPKIVDYLFPEDVWYVMPHRSDWAKHRPAGLTDSSDPIDRMACKVKSWLSHRICAKRFTGRVPACGRGSRAWLSLIKPARPSLALLRPWSARRRDANPSPYQTRFTSY